MRFYAQLTLSFFVDHAGDPDADVKAQAEKARLKQHVAAEQSAVLPVDAAHDPGVGKLVLAHQAMRSSQAPPCSGGPGPSRPISVAEVGMTLFLEPDYEPRRFDPLHWADFVQTLLLWITLYVYFTPSGMVPSMYGPLWRQEYVRR